MTYAHKIDSNQNAIVDGLRRVGCSVQSLARIGQGCPDLLVSNGPDDLYLLEVKTDSGKLTEDQIAWKQQWKGRVCVVRSVEEAFRAIGIKV